MKKVLLIALLAVASAAEAQNVVPAAVAPVELLQAPAPASPPQPPAPARAPSAPRPATARPAPAPAAPPAAPASPVPLQSIQTQRPDAPAANIRFDVTITDTGGPKPVTKTLSLTVTPGNNSASIRSSARTSPDSGPVASPDGKTNIITAPVSVALNVDIRAVTWVEANAVRAQVNVEYQPYMPDARIQPGAVSASATSAFYDGRKTQILVTADPVSDRKTSIEVTATILK